MRDEMQGRLTDLDDIHHASRGDDMPSLCGLDKKSTNFWVSKVRTFFGADYGSRTRHLDLGKVALYQMS